METEILSCKICGTVPSVYISEKGIHIGCYVSLDHISKTHNFKTKEEALKAWTDFTKETP